MGSGVTVHGDVMRFGAVLTVVSVGSGVTVHGDVMRFGAVLTVVSVGSMLH